MQQVATNNQLNSDIIGSLIINGDLSKLSVQQKVEYYKMYCDNLGLTPSSQPFSLLRLNGKEILYCTRSGAQQLNKLHKVSHDIKAREIVSGCYVVTAQASTPDGRHTECIGAVTIENAKGDSLCNAMMKAETKAKRRATLDLLGLGILDEQEIESIPNAQPMEFTETEDVPTAEQWKTEIESCSDMLALGALYNRNKQYLNDNPELLELMGKRRKEIEDAITA